MPKSQQAFVLTNDFCNTHLLLMKYSFIISFFLCVASVSHGQVGIETTTPNAALDVASTDSGILIPRVALASVTDTATVTNPNGGPLAESTLVYNDGSTTVAAGFYYWNGSQWTRLQEAVTAGWALNGNAGTDVSTNFLGTTDNEALGLRTNNQERLVIAEGGNVGVPLVFTDSKFTVVNGNNQIGSTVLNTNFTNTFPASAVSQAGVGNGQQIQIINGTSPGIAQLINSTGTGTGQFINLSNAGNTGIGSAIIHRGASGVGGFIRRDPNANASSTGQLITYQGTAAGGTGGGNALEVQHLGTNGNAAEIFVGNPSLPVGPTNGNDYAGLAINHFTTGSSPATSSKSAITGINNSADPTAIFSNEGADGGGAIVGVSVPQGGTTFNAAITGESADGTNAIGVGVYGRGGLFGVLGQTASAAGFGIFSRDNTGAMGAKSFLVDHPIYPEAKYLRHYSVESNEILNKYRGNVTIAADGTATVVLPDYFAAANIDPTYQLTGIGSPVVPYVKSEIQNNTFIIAGEPGMKVSWEVTAQRNDPTIQHFDAQQGGYTDVMDKEPANHGKYLSPAAHGKPETSGIFYSKPLKKVVPAKAMDADKLELPEPQEIKFPRKSQDGKQ